MQTENRDQVTVILDFFCDMFGGVTVEDKFFRYQDQFSPHRFADQVTLTASFESLLARPWIGSNPNIFDLSVKICILHKMSVSPVASPKSDGSEW